MIKLSLVCTADLWVGHNYLYFDHVSSITSSCVISLQTNKVRPEYVKRIPTIPYRNSLREHDSKAVHVKRLILVTGICLPIMIEYQDIFYKIYFHFVTNHDFAAVHIFTVVSSDDQKF